MRCSSALAPGYWQQEAWTGGLSFGKSWEVNVFALGPGGMLKKNHILGHFGATSALIHCSSFCSSFSVQIGVSPKVPSLAVTLGLQA